jgi:hypothetical protein
MTLFALYGLIGAQVISTIALLALLLAVRFSRHRGELRADQEAAAGRVLWIFVPNAIAVVGSLMLRVIPSTDLRSAASVFALGPLSAIRSLVMIVGGLPRRAQPPRRDEIIGRICAAADAGGNCAEFSCGAQARQIGDLVSEEPS